MAPPQREPPLIVRCSGALGGDAVFGASTCFGGMKRRTFAGIEHAVFALCQRRLFLNQIGPLPPRAVMYELL